MLQPQSPPEISSAGAPLSALPPMDHARFVGRLLFAGVGSEELMAIDLAYDLVKFGHRNVERMGGDRYFEHVRSVALILLEEAGIHDGNVLVTALLHDTVEDTWLLGSTAAGYLPPREIAAWRLE